MTKEKPIVAAFDFDGTLTYRDTLLPFLWFATTPSMFTLSLMRSLPAIMSYAVGATSRQSTKEQVLSLFFLGVPLSEIQKKGRYFAEKKLYYKIKPEAYRRFLWHKEQGHRCILVSANLDVYLESWAKNQGFDDCVTSRLEADSKGLFTGKLIGKNCWGPEKMHRLERLLGPRNEYELYAYGDSRGDREMLSAADHAYFRKIPILENSAIKQRLSEALLKKNMKFNFDR